MKLISQIEIDHFRSFQQDTINEIGNFTALAGKNNSGKSNVLRSLHAFFTGKTDIATPLSIEQDYYRHELSSKSRKKRIRISVTFNLPVTFHFRSEFKVVKDLLGGQNFKITKEWTRSSITPIYYLSDDPSHLSEEDRLRIDQFLTLISFRYIPNRVLPLDIIRSEHQALRDVLIRRLAKKARKQKEVFSSIQETSSTLIHSLEKRVHEASSDVGTIRLATPTSWQDMIFAFGYKLGVGNVEIDDTAQGSGIQSLLMFETLALIDKDFFQQFGWKQAAVWAVEEPESSLHSTLEANVASYLAQVSSDPSGRLQIISTTHSDLVLQHADTTVLVSMMGGKSTIETDNKEKILERSATLGISRWVHPILTYPLDPLVLVEGKYDHAFVKAALLLLRPSCRIRVAYLEQLQSGTSTGGGDDLLKYLKANVHAMRTRLPSAPIIVVLDWDAAAKKTIFENLLTDRTRYKVLAWPESTFNPKLAKSFRGIERHMPDRIIDSADTSTNFIGTKKDGVKTIGKDDYGTFKASVFEVVKAGLKMEDLQYAKTFIEEIIQAIQ